jgi:hypothetical protein
VEGLCYPLHRPTDYSWQMWELCLLTGTVPSRHMIEASMVLDHLSVRFKTLRNSDPFLVLTVCVPCRPNLLWRTLPSSAELIWCLSNHDIYAFSHGGVAMSGGDGTHTSS